jgi:hydroxyethylthiazole kinase-like uncharacterized protein yjeF
MLKILTSRQVRELDAFTIAEEPIASIDLMERACRGIVNWLVNRYDAGHRVGVVCGPGNNGGDGLGVARLLKEWGYPVKVWIVTGGKHSQDFLENRKRLPANIPVAEVREIKDFNLDNEPVLIDALFGTGLNKPLEGIFDQVVTKMNESDGVLISLDIPSGLPADRPLQGVAVRAHHTLSFQLPKLSFLFPGSYPYTGEWHLIDIGLHKSFLKEVSTPNFWITRGGVRKLLRARSRFSHKGDYGHALLVAGSTGKAGAAILAARAALRSGVGLLTVHLPLSCNAIMQGAVPEAMTLPDDHPDHVAGSKPAEKFSCIGIGPGLGQSEQTADVLYQYLKSARPMVIDADALNIFSAHQHWRSAIPHGSVLTPHPGEFLRLVGNWEDDFQRLDLQKSLAAELQSIVVLKGPYTSVATPDGRVFFNSTGNPGMARGGTGDALTGIITGLLAQGYPAEEAAILGVYIHGLAGDLAAREMSQEAMVAGDLIELLPAAFRQIRG